ncbi:glycosyltransferase family 4 protein [Virgisporangium ochraceum]|uniref:Glycosyl transferase family 1 n=1 Tax=Virgisporangium ochraceum TaxID=65505 RepID=A0A8J4EAJ1_9ACTN|nr:glycosyltransferase family 4 protein [Virgisporangium ochraceum]GIJ68350.1 glycosyl transferase family 1 [Virgisporangium ochraceum]
MTFTVSLVTVGDPDTMTGGYLYHRRVADRAAANDARIDFRSLPTSRFPLPLVAGRSLMRRLARERPDVVLLDSIAAAFVGPFLGPSLPPVAAILHQPPGGIDHGAVRRSLQARLDRAAYDRVARLLVASDDLADTLRKGGLPGDLMRVVPPGRDPATSSVVTPPGDLRAGRGCAVLSVGNWVARKGLLELLSALSALPPDAFTLHLLGDPGVEPAYAARVRARLAAPDLADRVVVHGVRTPAEVVGFYRAADVFALASLREPYGTVYGEAMAEGLPVVGWDAGNLPHLARNGVEGLAVPPGDVPALTEALRSLTLDASLRERMAAAARLRAAEFPTWDDTARMVFDELRRVAKEAGR